MLKKYVVIFLLCMFYKNICNAQKFVNKASLQLCKTIGDLNIDSLADFITVEQDTIDKFKRYTLKVFFAIKSGGYNLVAASDSVIQPQYPYGNGYSTDTFFDTVTIEKGIIIISTELIRGGYQHKFRYQNNKFELIGFHSVNSDGHRFSEERDFNLSTGVMVVKVKNYETDKIVSNKKSKININPLPSLQKFTPLSSMYDYKF